ESWPEHGLNAGLIGPHHAVLGAKLGCPVTRARLDLVLPGVAPGRRPCRFFSSVRRSPLVRTAWRGGNTAGLHLRPDRALVVPFGAGAGVDLHSLGRPRC